ncbi:hypothetical protein EW093_17130 (plasmid) [Thiospirochaeta perfilievii]|uniref:Uncharacterized protein n=1 Tax=Thiospirochaeta perfilievii TaxID=252967 RepID=A0A5C1QFZ0_9SPIO|nr:hypothetical protein [Thiospirochaeta perfilievii]QEN06431.1 hypothetical protein EW093_17130 [Thiospirochaeta perfilievii]
MHLSQKHNDELLFYVNDHDTIYFLSIGNHKDMYRKNNVEIIVNEYPHLLPILKIFPLPVLMSRSSNYSVEQIKVLWESGNNILLQINDQSYMGMPQTFSNISNQNIITSQNHIYQLESQLEAILTSLKQDSNKVNLRLLYAKSRLSIKQGVIHFKDRVSGKEFQVASDFLLLLNTINIILGIKNVSN